MINTSQQLIAHLKVHRNWEWWRLVESCEKVELPHAVRACVYFNTLYFQRNNVGCWTLTLSFVNIIIQNELQKMYDKTADGVVLNCLITVCSVYSEASASSLKMLNLEWVLLFDLDWRITKSTYVYAPKGSVKCDYVFRLCPFQNLFSKGRRIKGYLGIML